MREERKKQIMENLIEFNASERCYRELYLACPEIFCIPIDTWMEFNERYVQCKPDAVFPENAPSPILPWLSEKEWFPENGIDIALIKNSRYCPPFWHELEFVKIICVLRGNAYLFVEDKMLTISEGNLCIVSPKIRNAVFSCHDDDIVINIIIKRSTFENVFAGLLMENSGLSDFFWQMLYKKNSNKVLPFKQRGECDMAEYVLNLYDELYCEKIPSAIMVKSYLMLFSGQILRHYEEHRELLGKVQQKPERISGILRYIAEHRQSVTLPQLAAEFHISEGYLSRYIKRETGETFYAILRRMRMEQAAEMLKNSECSIEEICYAVGYSDVTRFYRNFKGQYGVTPSQFRRSI